LNPAGIRGRGHRREIRRLGHLNPAGWREDGQLMVLIIGYVLLGMLVATVVTAASSVYIEHKKLLSLADGASMASAGSFTLGQLETSSGSPTAVLTSGRVRGAAAEYLSRSGAFARISDLAVAPGTGSPDGATAVVVLRAAVHPPVVNFLIPAGIRIEASSTARSRLTR
jgi:hypothetical protein